MAKIIVSCRFQKSAKDMADLIRYMATREGVERLSDTKKYKIATASQHDLILSVVKHFPQSKKFLEYDDFYAMPTRENANEFLDAVAERYADRADELKGLVSYISNCPGVEKLGSHGLFTQFDMSIDLDTVAEERSKIHEKKQAHGQKEGADGTGIDDEVYDSQAVEGRNANCRKAKRRFDGAKQLMRV